MSLVIFEIMGHLWLAFSSTSPSHWVDISLSLHYSKCGNYLNTSWRESVFRVHSKNLSNQTPQECWYRNSHILRILFDLVNGNRLLWIILIHVLKVDMTGQFSVAIIAVKNLQWWAVTSADQWHLASFLLFSRSANCWPLEDLNMQLNSKHYIMITFRESSSVT
jgi:hypothetical protein